MQIYRRLDSSAEMIRWALAVSMALLVSMAQAQEGPVCRVCADASDEIVCSLEATQQCNPNQVCQTSARCTPNGVLMKKGCIGSSNVDALDTLECLNGDTKCNLFCDTDYCNDGSGPTVIAAIACSSDDSADDTVANPEPEDTSVAVTCQTCSDSTDEESCNAQGTTKQCNPNQVCQTVVRCTSTGIFVKKGCVGSIDAADVNAAAVCKDADNDNCALYCTGDLCNQVSVDAFSEVLTCPVKATGIMCHSCTDSASEEECLTPETLEQCNPNQVCQTVVRCINTEGIMVKKGCVGAESAVDVNGGPSCDDETNTKCSTYCDTEQCNAGDVAAIGNLLACPVKAVGPMCRFCEESEDEATCDQGELIQCNPNQVCQTSRRCLGDGSGDSMIKKGCLGSGSTLETPFCETDENTKCLYTCDTDGCNDATSALIDSVIACPIKGVGPICTVCDEVDNEGDCNTQGDPQTCRESEVCFAKVLCDRPNETVRYKKRCMNIDVVDMANINQMTCENIDNCSLACDSDYCNTDTSDLFESLSCPVKPPGIDCKKCADVYDESECEDVTCRDGNLCYTKVICERDSGLFRISKRCKRESRSDPTMLDNPVCPKDTKCEMTCGTDNCNAEAEPLLDIMECEVGPTDAPPTPTPEPEVTAEPEIPGPAEPECNAVTGTGADVCSCVCTCETEECTETTTPVPPVSLGCTAGWEGPNVVSSYDGAAYSLNSNNKFLMSQYIGDLTDQCKFQVRVDTEDGPQVGWTGIAFGPDEKKDDKFGRNLRVSLTQGLIEMRGRGINPPVLADPCIETSLGSEPWTFCQSSPSPGVFAIRGEVPSLGCWFSVLYEEAGSGDNDTGNDRMSVESSDYYDGMLTGICGNRDGDPSNDAEFCPRNTGDVSADCIDGSHQNNG